MGVFHEVGPQAFPTALSQGFLVLEWEAGPAEVGKSRDLRLAFVDPDGNEKLALGVTIMVPGPQRPGSPALFNQIINVAGTPLERPGEHAFYVLTDNDEKGRIALYVQEPLAGGEPNA